MYHSFADVGTLPSICIIIPSFRLELIEHASKSFLVYVTIESINQHDNVLYRFPEQTGKRVFKVLEPSHFRIPVGTRAVNLRIHVREKKFTSKKCELFFFGETCISLADYIRADKPGSEVYWRDIYGEGRRSNVSLSNKQDVHVAWADFAMHVDSSVDQHFLQAERGGSMRRLATDGAEPWIPNHVQTLLHTLHDMSALPYTDPIVLLHSAYILKCVIAHWSMGVSLLQETHVPSVVEELRASQGNAFDDLLTQNLSHLVYLRDAIRNHPNTEERFRERIRILLHHIFLSIVLICAWAPYYTVATYQYLQKGAHDALTSQGLFMIKRIMMVTVRSRYSMLRELRPELADDDKLGIPSIASLEDGAVRELTMNEERLCADTLFSLRFEQASQAIDHVQKRLNAHLTDAQSTSRDALRRILTHITQESNCLPSSLLIHVEKGSQVDGGAFATIYRGSVRQGGNKIIVAMKAIKVYPRTGETLNRLRQMYLEVISCQSLVHDHIVKLLGIYESKDEAFIVMPYYRNGNSINYLSRIRGMPNYRNGRLIGLIHRWFFQLASGITYLHEEGIVHGDIRGVNLLISDDEGLLIADFGLSVFANGGSQQYLSKRTGNAQWMAPELFGKVEGTSLRPTKSSDVYSFSHTCIELYTGQPPYHFLHGDVDDTQVKNAVVRDRARPPLPIALDFDIQKPMDDAVYGLLEQCWDENPSCRPNIEAVERRLRESGYHAS